MTTPLFLSLLAGALMSCFAMEALFRIGGL